MKVLSALENAEVARATDEAIHAESGTHKKARQLGRFWLGFAGILAVVTVAGGVTAALVFKDPSDAGLKGTCRSLQGIRGTGLSVENFPDLEFEFHVKDTCTNYASAPIGCLSRQQPNTMNMKFENGTWYFQGEAAISYKNSPERNELEIQLVLRLGNDPSAHRRLFVMRSVLNSTSLCEKEFEYFELAGTAVTNSSEQNSFNGYTGKTSRKLATSLKGRCTTDPTSEDSLPSLLLERFKQNPLQFALYDTLDGGWFFPVPVRTGWFTIEYGNPSSDAPTVEEDKTFTFGPSSEGFGYVFMAGPLYQIESASNGLLDLSRLALGKSYSCAESKLMSLPVEPLVSRASIVTLGDNVLEQTTAQEAQCIDLCRKQSKAGTMEFRNCSTHCFLDESGEARLLLDRAVQSFGRQLIDVPSIATDAVPQPMCEEMNKKQDWYTIPNHVFRNQFELGSLKEYVNRAETLRSNLGAQEPNEQLESLLTNVKNTRLAAQGFSAKSEEVEKIVGYFHNLLAQPRAFGCIVEPMLQGLNDFISIASVCSLIPVVGPVFEAAALVLSEIVNVVDSANEAFDQMSVDDGFLNKVKGFVSSLESARDYTLSYELFAVQFLEPVLEDLSFVDSELTETFASALDSTLKPLLINAENAFEPGTGLFQKFSDALEPATQVDGVRRGICTGKEILLKIREIYYYALGHLYEKLKRFLDTPIPIKEILSGGPLVEVADNICQDQIHKGLCAPTCKFLDGLDDAWTGVTDGIGGAAEDAVEAISNPIEAGKKLFGRRRRILGSCSDTCADVCSCVAGGCHKELFDRTVGKFIGEVTVRQVLEGISVALRSADTVMEFIKDLFFEVIEDALVDGVQAIVDEKSPFTIQMPTDLDQYEELFEDGLFKGIGPFLKNITANDKQLAVFVCLVENDYALGKCPPFDKIQQMIDGLHERLGLGDEADEVRRLSLETGYRETRRLRENLKTRFPADSNTVNVMKLQHPRWLEESQYPSDPFCNDEVPNVPAPEDDKCVGCPVQRCHAPMLVLPLKDDPHEKVRALFASFDELPSDQDFAHWVAHYVNAGEAKWFEDAKLALIQRTFARSGRGIEGAELQHWSAHYDNHGHDQWMQDFCRNNKGWPSATSVRLTKTHCKSLGPLAPQNQQPQSIVWAFFASFGLFVSQFDFNHWTAHYINAGGVQWLQDASKDVVKRTFANAGKFSVPDFDINHWTAHFEAAGQTQWMQDFCSAEFDEKEPICHGPKETSPVSQQASDRVRSFFASFGITQSDADLAHWSLHYIRVDSAVWVKDAVGDVFKHLVSRNGGASPSEADINHWVSHYANANHQTWVQDLCKNFNGWPFQESLSVNQGNCRSLIKVNPTDGSPENIVYAHFVSFGITLSEGELAHWTAHYVLLNNPGAWRRDAVRNAVEKTFANANRPFANGAERDHWVAHYANVGHNRWIEDFCNGAFPVPKPEPCDAFGSVAPASNDAHDRVVAFFISFGIKMSKTEHAHWVAHLVNAGEQSWRKDALKQAIQHVFGSVGEDIVGFELEHWTSHYHNVGHNKWMEDFCSNHPGRKANNQLSFNTCPVLREVSPVSAGNPSDVVRSVFASFGIVLSHQDFVHWVSHHINAGAQKWNVDALRNAVTGIFLNAGKAPAEGEVTHWVNHHNNAGHNKWVEDFCKDALPPPTPAPTPMPTNAECDSIRLVAPASNAPGDYVPAFFMSFGIRLSIADYNHWVAHFVNAGEATWGNDAIVMAVRHTFGAAGRGSAAESEINHWVQHYKNVGHNAWMQDFCNNNPNYADSDAADFGTCPTIRRFLPVKQGDPQDEVSAIYASFGITLSPSDYRHWVSHYVQAGAGQWRSDALRDCVQRSFAIAGRNPNSGEVTHWLNHHNNAGHNKWVEDFCKDALPPPTPAPTPMPTNAECDSIRLVAPASNAPGDYVPAFFMSFGIRLSIADYNHWVAHFVNAGEATWRNDAIVMAVRHTFGAAGRGSAAESEINHWVQHYKNAGHNAWMQDFCNNNPNYADSDAADFGTCPTIRRFLPVKQGDPQDEVSAIYASFGITLSPSDYRHWVSHYVQAGAGQWRSDALRDCVQRSFVIAGRNPSSGEVTHWANHHNNAGHNKWIEDFCRDALPPPTPKPTPRPTPLPTCKACTNVGFVTPASGDPHDIVRAHFASFGYSLSGGEFSHWVAHYVNAGDSQWKQDWLRDCIRRKFGDAGRSVGDGELNHWIAHYHNVGHGSWMNDFCRNSPCRV